MVNISKTPFYILPRRKETKNANKVGFKKYECDICHKMFKQSGHLSTHKKLKHSECKYFCEHEGCGRQFAVKWALRTHMKIHSNEKAFKCEECDKTFHQKINLTYHISSVHKKERFDCENCNKSFKTKYHLKYHQNKNCDKN